MNRLILALFNGQSGGQVLLVMLFILSLVACKGGDDVVVSNKDNPPPNTETIIIEEMVTTQDPIVGEDQPVGSNVIVVRGGPVRGLAYTSHPSGEGGMTGNGNFICKDGDTLTFAIGNLVLGKAPCQPVITLFDILGTTDEDNKVLINIARFLQTLDNDQDPDNGITINDATMSAINQTSIDNIITDPNFNFDNDLKDLFTRLGIKNIVTAADAQSGIQQTLAIQTWPTNPPESLVGIYSGFSQSSGEQEYLHLDKNGAFMLEAIQWPALCQDSAEICKSLTIMRSYGVYKIEDNDLKIYTLSAREIKVDGNNEIVPPTRLLKSTDMDPCWTWSLAHESVTFPKNDNGEISFSQKPIYAPERSTNCPDITFTKVEKIESDPYLFKLPDSQSRMCGTQQNSLGININTDDERSIDIGSPEGTIELSYTTYSVPDQIIVSYEDKIIFDSGCDPTNNSTKTKDISYPPPGNSPRGNSSILKVKVKPGCSKNNVNETSWSYTLGCTQKTNQTITFNNKNISLVIGEEKTISVTGGGSDQPVTLTTDTPDICSVTDNVVKALAFGECVILANQNGNDDDYNPATQAKLSITVKKLEQNITITLPPLVLGENPVIVTATATKATGADSGLPVYLSTENSAICKFDDINKKLLHAKSAGPCVIIAEQPGDNSYKLVQITKSIPVESRALVHE